MEHEISFAIVSFTEFSLRLHQPCYCSFNPLSANPEKWSNTLKQFVRKFPTNCLSVFDHFMNLALKGLRINEADYYNEIIRIT